MAKLLHHLQDCEAPEHQHPAERPEDRTPRTWDGDWSGFPDLASEGWLDKVDTIAAWHFMTDLIASDSKATKVTCETIISYKSCIVKKCCPPCGINGGVGTSVAP